MKKEVTFEMDYKDVYELLENRVKSFTNDLSEMFLTDDIWVNSVKSKEMIAFQKDIDEAKEEIDKIQLLFDLYIELLNEQKEEK